MPFYPADNVRSQVRPPAVAGRFYPADPDELGRLVEWCRAHPIGPGGSPDAGIASTTSIAIAPHAGLVYSGPVAAHAHLALAGSRRVVIVGPSHFGSGSAVALSSAAAWRTPLGDIPVDTALTATIASRCPFASVDDHAHRDEHSIEVQLPFIAAWFAPGTTIVPIALGGVLPAHLVSLGLELGGLVSAGDVSLLATTDLSHYLRDDIARSIDDRTIADIVSGDPDRLVRSYRESVAQLCGLGPVVVAMVAARHAGLVRPRLLARCTSADTGGPPSSVVGYAAIAFYPD